MKKLLVFQPVDVHESRVPTKFLYENKKKEKKIFSREKKYLKFSWKFTFVVNSDGEISTFVGLVRVKGHFCLEMSLFPISALNYVKNVTQYETVTL